MMTPICIRPHKVILATFVIILSVAVSAANSPREKILMDFGWRFHLGDAPDAGMKFFYPEVNNLLKTQPDEVGKEPASMATPDLGGKVSFVQPKFDDSGWRQLDLPHDWAVELPFDPNGEFEHSSKPIGTSAESEHPKKAAGAGFPENSIGWYRRNFELTAADQGKSLWLEFDGVYRNSLVWLNGHCLGRHPDGYTSFRYDISKFANFGGKNELVVRVDAWRFEGWFYEGAGIYRHVWLVKTSPVHVSPDGVFVFSKFPDNIPGGPAEIDVRTRLVNAQGSPVATTLTQEILDADGNTVAKLTQSAGATGAGQEMQTALKVPSPALWSPETPNLYQLVTTVGSEEGVVDKVETEFGIRTTAFDPEKGFLLNGKPYLIKGTCNHQDHAGVGSAVPDALQYFRVRQLKEMGCNAYRTAHNAPAPELIVACDRLGMLVMDENRRVDTNSTTLSDLASMVLRDRNHPSVFIWSLGNEEPISATDVGMNIAIVMQGLVHELDPTRLCTAAMVHGWGRGFSKVLDVQGFNYGIKNVAGYLKQHPSQPGIGTETGSTYVDRGVYADDKTMGYVNGYGESHPGWGAKAWDSWGFYAAHPFAGGSFVWTGFDYRGEPKPYKWPGISSHFGSLDTCGFPKDIYYYYQAWWTDKPVLHIAPHWNWPGKEGETNLVYVFSNCKEVELFLNGVSLGRQTMPVNDHLTWGVRYVPGTLSAKGYDGEKVIMETKVETTGEPASIRLAPDRYAIKADGEDVSVVNVSVTDAAGRVVPTAANLIHFKLDGPGKIIGVGNGNPGSHEPDKGDERTVFNGLAQVLVQSKQRAGAMVLTATAKDLKDASVTIQIEGHKLTGQNQVPTL
jgi:beta-galactosidase